MFVKNTLREVGRIEFEAKLSFRKCKRNDRTLVSCLAKQRHKHVIPVLRRKLDTLDLEAKRLDSDTPRSLDTDKLLKPPRKKQAKVVNLSFYERSVPVVKEEPLPYEQYLHSLLKQQQCRQVDVEVVVSRLNKLKKHYPSALKIIANSTKKFSYDSSRPPLLDSAVKHSCSFSLAEAFYSSSAPQKDPDALKDCCAKMRAQKAQIKQDKLDRYYRPKTQAASAPHSPQRMKQHSKPRRYSQINSLESTQSISRPRTDQSKRRALSVFSITPSNGSTRNYTSPLFDLSQPKPVSALVKPTPPTSAFDGNIELIEELVNPVLFKPPHRKAVEPELLTVEDHVPKPSVRHQKGRLSVSSHANYNTKLL
jgi:hypothetical protein